MHYYLHVILPSDIEIPQIEEEVENRLHPFDEANLSSPHDTKCYCVGWEATREAIVQCNEAGIDDPIERRDFIDTTVANDPKKGFPDPNCADCDGTGVHTTTANPNGKWEWWGFGGRWQDIIYDLFPQDKREVLKEKYRAFKGNTCSIQELLAFSPREKEFQVPYAFLDLKGTWHSRDLFLTQEGWSEEYFSYLEKHSDALIIACDIHQ